MTNLPHVSTISESRPLARTPHVCTVCGLPIAIGSRYSKHVLCNHDSINPKKRLVVVRWHLPYCPEGES